MISLYPAIRTRYAGGSRTAAFCTATTKYDLVPIYNLETIKPVALLSPTREHIVSSPTIPSILGMTMTLAPESNIQYRSSPDVGALKAPTLIAETDGSDCPYWSPLEHILQITQFEFFSLEFLSVNIEL